MKYLAFLFLSLSCSLLLAQTEWKNSTVIKISTTNEWCRHCPDSNQTSYSFKLDDGTVYVAQTHKKLDVTLNGHTKFRFEKDGHVGDHVHILDDAGKDQELRITEKIAAEKRSE
jgi:hypothetical protein